MQSSWPPPPESELNPKEALEAALEKRELLETKVWGWKRTQYIGGVWSSSDDTSEYTIAFSKGDNLHIDISCRKLKSDYHVSQGSLDIDVEPSVWGDCPNNNLDAMFVNDLNRVVDYRVADDALVLELGSGNGSMFFVPISQSLR